MLNHQWVEVASFGNPHGHLSTSTSINPIAPLPPWSVSRKLNPSLTPLHHVTHSLVPFALACALAVWEGLVHHCLQNPFASARQARTRPQEHLSHMHTIPCTLSLLWGMAHIRNQHLWHVSRVCQHDQWPSWRFGQGHLKCSKLCQHCLARHHGGSATSGRDLQPHSNNVPRHL